MTTNKNTQPLVSEQADERARLRAEQAAAVMPLIGPMLDAFDGMPGDFRSDLTEEAPGLYRHIKAISAAMTADSTEDHALTQQASSEAPASEQVAELLPVDTLAWALIATTGNIIIWSRNRSTVEGYCSRYPESTVMPIIGVSTAATTASASGEAEEAAKLQTLLAEEFACYRPTWPAGLYAWARIALLDNSPHHRTSAPAPSREAAPLDFFAIKFIEQRAAEYLRDHASSEHDTGATVWHYGDAGRDYHSSLVELADDLRAALSQQGAAQQPTGSQR
jgi:hypothetical protein